jgi:hypothetical protein
MAIGIYFDLEVSVTQWVKSGFIALAWPLEFLVFS